MVTSILATKLHIPPPRSQIVLRPRLLARLNEGQHRKLTLISAPAGFGKTTLVSEWINHKAEGGAPRAKDESKGTLPPSSFILHPSKVAWLSLDDGDNDLARFLTYLVAALQTTAPNVGAGVLAVLQSSQPPPAESLLTALLNEITTLPDHFILVLDDYHLIDAKSVDDTLTFLIEHQPPQMHLVITTREDPRLPLAQLRVRDQLTELRASDLRFTSSEAADFLNQVMRLNLSTQDIAALETRTEGWIAGLQLAALSMQGHHDTTSFIKSFTGSHHFILDYLIQEVLQKQSEIIQTFLLRTSILDRLSGSLCDAVVCDPAVAGQATLEYLERANLFIVPLDNERHWYRYHHLFADLLQQRLHQGAFDMAELHKRASVWYEANDNVAEAFHHAHAAGDFERAARLAEAAWQGMERNFQTAAWLGWVKKLPDVTICSRPRLCLQLGSAFMDAGKPEMSETYLQNAESALAGVTDEVEKKSLLGNIALIRASNAQNQGNVAETVKYAELSLQFIPEDDFYFRAQAVITLELTHWATGDLEASLRAMYAWTDDMLRSGNQVFVIASAFAVADMQVILGRLSEAEKVLRQAIQQAAALGQEAESLTAHHHLGLALLAHERGDEVAMTQHLQTAAAFGQHTTLVDWSHRWNLAQARLKESAGEWDAALELFDEAKRGYVKTAIPMLQPVEAHKARIYLKQGRLDKAQSWVQDRRLSVTDEVNYLGEYEYLTLARVRLAEGSFAGVGELLERLLALAETQNRIGSVIEILLTQALVQQAQGNRPQALAALEHVLAFAEPEGYLRIFVDEGEPMRFLISDLRVQIENRTLAEYADKILNPFPPTKIENRKSEIPFEPLSEREMQVLRLLRSELSGPEIAQQLIVSLNTLRTHTKSIFNKLGVNNRRAAVHRAEELDLF